MGQSLKSRLNGCTKEFLQDVERFGAYYTMEIWSERLDGYHDLIGLHRFIEAETNNPDFGRNPKFNLSGGRDLGTQIIQAMAEYIIKSNTQLQSLKEENEYLRKELSVRTIQNTQAITPLLEALRT